MPLETRNSRRARASGDNATRHLRERFGMSQRIFARLLGISERSLAKFEKQSDCGEKIRRQVNSLDRLQRALAQVIRTDEIAEWFQTPNPAFGGLKPLEVVERGETDRIWAMIYDLGAGTPG